MSFSFMEHACDRLTRHCRLTVDERRSERNLSTGPRRAGSKLLLCASLALASRARSRATIKETYVRTYARTHLIRTLTSSMVRLARCLGRDEDFTASQPHHGTRHEGSTKHTHDTRGRTLQQRQRVRAT